MVFSMTFRLIILAICFVTILTIFRGPWDTGWPWIGDVFSAIGFTCVVQCIPFLRVL